jgi:hypothetical protein
MASRTPQWDDVDHSVGIVSHIFICCIFISIPSALHKLFTFDIFRIQVSWFHHHPQAAIDPTKRPISHSSIPVPGYPYSEWEMSDRISAFWHQLPRKPQYSTQDLSMVLLVVEDD